MRILSFLLRPSWSAVPWRREAGHCASSDVELIDLRTEVADIPTRTKLCQQFFLGIYRAAFPKVDQTETPDVWLPLLNEDRPLPFPLLHLILARERSRPDHLLGGMVIEYFRRSQTALATYLAVSPRAQNRGVGRRLLRKGIEVVSADNGGIPPIILAEVERPDAQPDEAARFKAQSRLSVIAALGGRGLKMPYIQPALGLGQKPVTDLMLVVLETDAALNCMPAFPLRVFLEEFFSSLGQGETSEVQNLLGSLPLDNIELFDLQ